MPRLLVMFVCAVSLLFIATARLAVADDASDFNAAIERGRRLADAAEYSAAAKEFERAVAIAERAFGKNHETSAIAVNNLAYMYNNLSDYSKAEALYLRNLKTVEALFGADHPNIALALENLANVYFETAQYAKAESILLRSLKIRESKLGADHLDVAKSLNNLGLLYWKTHQFAKAEPLYLRSLKIRETKQGPDHPYVATVVNNLASLYDDLAQYKKAEGLYLRALKIDETHSGKDHPDTATILNNLALAYCNQGRFAEAEPLYLRSLKIREAKLGPDHPSVAVTINNLAQMYDTLGKFAKAEPLYQRSLKLNEAEFGPNHPMVALSLSNLALVYYSIGEYTKAEPLFLRSVKIREENLGDDHPEVARSLFGLALVETAVSKVAEAADHTEAGRRIVRKYVARTLPLLTDREQLAFLERSDLVELDSAFSLALLQPDNIKLAEQSAGWLANSKSVAFDTLAERAQLGRDARDPRLASTAKKLLAVRAELATLASTAVSSGKEAEQQTRLSDLQSQENTLSKEISAGRGEVVAADPWVEIGDIRRALPPMSILIDIVRFESLQFPQAATETRAAVPQKLLGQRYVAWIVPPADAGAVRVVDLGPAGEIDRAIANYQAAIAKAQSGQTIQEHGETAAEEALAQPLGRLSRLILEPLLPYLQDARELILSPDAGLWLVPWAALPLEKDQYAIERWKMRFVVAGREVALEKLRTSPVTPGAARVLANPDYDQAERDALVAYLGIMYPGAKPSAVPRVANSATVNELATRSATSVGRVARLPSTAVEAEFIAPSLKKLTQTEPRMYLDRNAQEGILKQIRNPQILVLSTHGYFLADQKEIVTDKDRRLFDVDRKSATINADGNPLENPLLRCGLLLAGCNERDKYTDPNLGDGVMTGLEIVGCDLRGTELVVLSACETGLGKVNNGEGVAGLRQAFQLAGARSVVSTLWQIPDKQSAVLMNDFFANLAAKQSKAEALRNAQLAMIKSRREKYGAAHPLFWAAWTLTGN